jgi:hypothetical protein
VARCLPEPAQEQVTPAHKGAGCAVVLCAAGTRCVEENGKARCVPGGEGAR